MTHHGRPSIKFRRPIFFGPEFREFRTFQRVDPEFFFNFFQSTRGESSFFPECCTPYWPQKKRNFSFSGFRMATRSRLTSRHSEFFLLLTSPTDSREEGRRRGGRCAALQPAKGGKALAPALPDVPRRRKRPPPPQINCRPRHRRRQQQLNPLGSTLPSSLQMGAGSSSAASKGRRDAPSSGTSALTQTSVLSAAHSLRIQDLEAQVRELKARLAETGANSASNPPPPLSPPTAVASPVNYAPCMALSAARRDLARMEAVFNRHAEPVGLSAKALVSALHAIDPSSFSAEVSDADAKKLMKRVDMNNKGHATFEELCQIAEISCDECDEGAEASPDDDGGGDGDGDGDDGDNDEEGAEASPARAPSDNAKALESARAEFLRFADVKMLSAPALMDALKEVDAPVLLSGEGCSPEQIFRRVDADISDSVDLAE
jgi:hypothetical protein